MADCCVEIDRSIRAHSLENPGDIARLFKKGERYTVDCDQVTVTEHCGPCRGYETKSYWIFKQDCGDGTVKTYRLDARFVFHVEPGSLPPLQVFEHPQDALMDVGAVPMTWDGRAIDRDENRDDEGRRRQFNRMAIFDLRNR